MKANTILWFLAGFSFAGITVLAISARKSNKKIGEQSSAIEDLSKKIEELSGRKTLQQ